MTKMKYEAILNYDKQLVQRAVFAFWRKTIGCFLLVSVAALTVFGGYLISIDGASWLNAVMLTVAAFAYIIFIALFVVHYRNSMNKLNKMRKPEATITVESSSFTITTSKASSTNQWCLVKGIWCFNGFWLILFSKAHFITVPLDNVSSEMKSFICEKVMEAGGKIVS